METVIFEHGIYRIIEIVDNEFDWDNLLGDSFTPKHNPDIPEEQLKQEEKAFIAKIEREGVYGYELQKWNEEIGMGWEHVDSCWGFVGRYADEKHYIVDEFQRYINAHV